MWGKLININAFYRYRNVINRKNIVALWWNFIVFEGILTLAFVMKLISNPQKIYPEFWIYAIAAAAMMCAWYFLKNKISRIQEIAIVVCYLIGFAFSARLETVFPGSHLVLLTYEFISIDLALSFVLSPVFMILGQALGLVSFLITYLIAARPTEPSGAFLIVFMGIFAIVLGLLAWNIKLSTLIFENELAYLATGTDDVFLANKQDGMWEDAEYGFFGGITAKNKKKRVFTFVFDESRDRLISVRDGNIFDLKPEMNWNEISTRIMRYAGDPASYRKIEKFLASDKNGREIKEDSRFVSASFNMPGGERMFLNLTMTYRPHPVSGTIMKIVSLEDVTGDKIFMGLTNMMFSENYDAVLCYERGKKRGILLYSDEGDEINLSKCEDYEEMMVGYITEYVADYDRERAIENAHLKNLCAYLQNNDYFETFLDECNGDAILKKRFYSSYLDDDKRFLVVMKQDVTELIKNEKEAGERLETALSEARAANEVKTEFLARMSHEMRTPMNAIVGLASLVEDANGNQELLKDYVGKIKSSSDYLLKLINDVLDMSGISDGHISMDIKEVKFSELLETINTIVVPLCTAKNIAYFPNSEIPENTVVRMDKVRVSQIFTNLLDNAVKYTSEGGIIEFNCYNMGIEAGKANYRFVVKDNGIGMTEDFAQHMFEPFSQEKETNRASLNGTGIGLSISKGIVEMLGGHISATSKPDVGTTFVVDIPLETLEKEEIKTEKRNEISLDSLRGKRVLVVEDNEINREIAVALLEGQDIITDVTINGLEAVSAFDKSPERYYDAILMDIRMPKMNGLEATRKIRFLNRKDAANVPIIAMTANAFSEDVDLSVNSGMNAHLSKPINPEVLYETLAKYISERK